MPCRVDDDDRSPSRVLFERVNTLTVLLCDACSRLEAMDAMPGTGGLSGWWEDHKRSDAKRKEDERRQREEQRRRDLSQAVQLMAKHNVKKLVRKD